MDWGIIFVALLGIAGTLLATFSTGRNQQALTRELFEEQKIRENIAYARQIAEARRDRLIKRYEDLALAAQAYMDACDVAYAVNLRLGPIKPKEPSDPSVGNWERLLAIYESVGNQRTELKRILPLLQIEVDNRDVVDACRELEKLAEQYLTEEAELTDTALALNQTMHDCHDKLVEAVRTHVQELERGV